MAVTNVDTPKDPNKVKKIEALRCYFGPDRELSTKELKALTSDERQELAELVCADTGWTLEPQA